MTLSDCKPGTVVITPTGRKAVVVRKFTRGHLASHVELRYVDGDQGAVNLRPAMLKPTVNRATVN